MNFHFLSIVFVDIQHFSYYTYKKYEKAGHIMGFGKRIKDRRAELRMSSTQLAEKIGVSKQTISGYELERTYPNPEKLSRIITALDCDANYLYQDFINIETLRKNRNGLTEEEFELIRKYRLLNDHSKFVVSQLAAIEYDRMLDGLERRKKSEEPLY